MGQVMIIPPTLWQLLAIALQSAPSIAPLHVHLLVRTLQVKPSPEEGPILDAAPAVLNENSSAKIEKRIRMGASHVGRSFIPILVAYAVRCQTPSGPRSRDYTESMWPTAGLRGRGRTRISGARFYASG